MCVGIAGPTRTRAIFFEERVAFIVRMTISAVCLLGVQRTWTFASHHVLCDRFRLQVVGIYTASRVAGLVIENEPFGRTTDEVLVGDTMSLHGMFADREPTISSAREQRTYPQPASSIRFDVHVLHEPRDRSFIHVKFLRSHGFLRQLGETTALRMSVQVFWIDAQFRRTCSAHHHLFRDL